MDYLQHMNGPTNTFQGLGMNPSAGGRPFGGFDTKLRPSGADPYHNFLAGHQQGTGGGAENPVFGEMIRNLLGALKHPGFLQQLQYITQFLGGTQ